MDRVRPRADRLLANPRLTKTWQRLTKAELRILAYHDVNAPGTFAEQMAHLVERYQVVDASTVVRAIRGEDELPHSPVWVTFDDGHPGVVEHALPILQENGISATIFVCPGLVDTRIPYWWDIVGEALRLGETWQLGDARFGGHNAERFKAALKSVPDEQRREVVQALADAIVARTGTLLTREQITTAQLERFAASGGDIGNHTWDHPCLDMCRPAEVDAQIRRADVWLRRFQTDVRLFAYPNGNYSRVAESVLSELGYDVAVLFDHQLTRRGQRPLSLSRLRVNDDSSIERFAAIVAGVHPALHRLRSGAGSIRSSSSGD